MKVSVLGRIALSLFALLPLMAGVSEAQDAAPASRVAFVNMRQVMDSTPGYSAAESTFVQEMTAWRGEFQQLQNRLDSAASAFEQQATMLSPSAREARRNELQAQQDSLQGRLAQLNQRAAMRGSISGVQMLTTPTNSRTASSSGRARLWQRCWSGPVVFMTSQVAPSRA